MRLAIDTIALQEQLIVFDMQWDTLKAMRSAVLKAIEQLREKGIIKHSFEAKVTLYFDADAPWYDALREFINALKRRAQTEMTFFKEFIIVSQVTFAQDHQNITDQPMLPDFLLVLKLRREINARDAGIGIRPMMLIICAIGV